MFLLWTFPLSTDGGNSPPIEKWEVRIPLRIENYLGKWELSTDKYVEYRLEISALGRPYQYQHWVLIHQHCSFLPAVSIAPIADSRKSRLKSALGSQSMLKHRIICLAGIALSLLKLLLKQEGTQVVEVVLTNHHPHHLHDNWNKNGHKDSLRWVGVHRCLCKMSRKVQDFAGRWCRSRKLVIEIAIWKSLPMERGNRRGDG